MKKYLDLEVNRKSTKSYELRFKKNGIALDITGWGVHFTVKTNMKDIDVNAVITKDITTHSDPVNGKTLINLTDTDTDRVGNFWYDFKYVDDENNKNVILWGKIKFREVVTQRV